MQEPKLKNVKSDTREDKSLKVRAKKLKTQIPAVYLALKGKDTPVRAKILAGITVAYALSPIDLIPDFIPVLGYLDDVLLLPVLIALTVKMIPHDVFKKYEEEAEHLWENGKPKRWYFAVPILILWMIIISLIIRALI